MGKSASARMQVTNYYMSLHFGLATTVDKLLGIYVNEKAAWEGVLSAEAVIDINRPELFGGLKKEGGLAGKAHFLPGGPSQVMPEQLAAKMGRTSATCPGYRGLSTVFFHAAPNNIDPFHPARNFQGNGFLWSSNNPVIAQNVWFKAQRAPKGLDPSRALIGPDANPAHMIFECMTDTDWGSGLPSTAFDLDSFSTAAETLWTEEFGLSMRWGQQTLLEEFVTEIIDHIQANLFIHPRTGLWTLKLIRDDYDVETLRTINPDNARLTSFQRKSWGEVTNEIAVTWTNPESGQDETVIRQNLAAIAIQGGIVSDGREYHGIRNVDLAARVCERDLRSASAPLATIEVALDRTAWDIVPGDVVIVDWPKYDIAGLVMRVGPVDYGKIGDPRIRTTLVEDIFSLERPLATGSPGTEWTPPGETPAPMANAQILTLPQFFVSSVALQAGVLDLEYPEVVSLVLANQAGTDTPLYELLSERTLSNGETDFAASGTKTTVDRSTLSVGLAAEAQSTLPGEDTDGALTGPQIGGFVFIGEGGDADMEIALVDAYDGFDWTLARGVLDTTPRDWPSGTPIWFVNPGDRTVDDKTVRSAGEEPEYKLLSRTSLGVLDQGDAPVESGALTARPHLPLRPANVTVNGTAFGAVAIGASTDITVSWATRNRLLEDGQVVRWDAGTVAPEYAQETVVSVYDQDDNLVYEQGSLWTETTLALPAPWFARYSAVTVLVRSRREGLWSLQGHSIEVTGLPANAGAALPPDPPAATLPPSPTAAPTADAFVAAGTAITSEDDATTPALLVTGTSDNPSATGLVLRYKRFGTSDYTFHPIVDLKGGTEVRVAISPVGALTSYTVEAAYQVGNAPLGAWRVLSPNPVTTGAFIASDVVSVAGRGAAQMVADIDEALERNDLTAEAIIRRALDNMGVEAQQTQDRTDFQYYRVSVSARFEATDGAINTAKSEAIAAALTNTNGAIAAYDTSVETDAGGLRATAVESLTAISELSGKVASRYMMELEAGDVVTGVYAVAERGEAGVSISGIKLRTDKLVITPSDGSYDGIPFAYDAVLGKLVLQDVVAKSANIDALAVKTLHIDGKQVTTDKIGDNAITQSVSAYTSGSISLTAGVEVAVQYVSISTLDDSRVKITSGVLITAAGSPTYTSTLAIYRRPSGGSWSLLYSIPGPQPFVTGITLTKQTTFSSVPTVVDDVVMGLNDAPTAVNGSSFNLSGSVTITGSGSLSGASVALSGTTGSTSAGGDMHSHGLGGSFSVTGGTINGSAYTGGLTGVSIGGSVSVPTKTAQMGKPTLALTWPFSSLVNDVTWTSAVYGIVPAFLVDMPGEGDWEYEVRITSSTTGEATNRFLEAEEIKK